jgi:lipopolysaccharide export LptBFGC system permease protein LptF
VYRAPAAFWEKGKIVLQGNLERNDIVGGQVRHSDAASGELDEPTNPFSGLSSKPSHLTSAELRQQLANADAEVEQRALSIAIDKRYAAMLLPLVIALFTAPFAIRLDRKKKAAAAIGSAVALWLLFTGTGSLFEQLGSSGLLPATVAVWSPLMIFGFLGAYLLSRLRT